MFKSLPFSPRQIRASEARLEKIYTAASLGLKGDSLAVASGMLPSEFNQLKQLDPVVELAILKGRADSELEHSGHLAQRSREGDGKASLAILQHQHGWTAKQDINLGGSALANLQVTFVKPGEVYDQVPGQVSADIPASPIQGSLRGAWGREILGGCEGVAADGSAESDTVAMRPRVPDIHQGFGASTAE